MITENRNIEAKDVKRLLLRVYRRYQSGIITEAQAYKESYLINSLLKAIELTDMEERLKIIELNLKENE